MTVRELITPILARGSLYPKRAAFLLGDRIIDYGTLARSILSVETRISRLGLSRDRVVGVCIPHPVPHLIVALALMKRGYATVSFGGTDAVAAAGCGMKDAICSTRLPFPELAAAGVRQHMFDDAWLSDSCANAFDICAVDPERVMRVSFTSGSTGVRKPIAHNSENLLNSVVGETFWKVETEQSVLSRFGLQSLVGFDIAVGSLVNGRSLAFAHDDDAALRLVERFGVNVIIGSTDQVASLANTQAKVRANVKSVRRISTGGGPVSVYMIRSVETAFPALIEDVYASTEAGVAGIATGDLLKRREKEGAKFYPLAEMRIDPVEGFGEGGLLGVRSRRMGAPFTGEMTVSPPDWFYPGDIGVFDTNGLLTLLGRADELINIGGVKVAPEVVEEALRRADVVNDVAVVRVAFDGGHQEAHALYVADREIKLDELNTALNTAGVKIRLTVCKRAAEVPRAESRKIAREKVRKLLAAAR